MTVVEWGHRATIHFALFASACLFTAWTPVVSTAAPPAVAASSGIPNEIREFDVLVDDKVRGTHRLAISSKGDVTTTRVETDVKVDLIVYVYAYSFRAKEVWQADKLIQVDTRVEDAGKKTSLTAKADGANCQVVLNGRQHVTDRGAVSTFYWRLPQSVDQKRVLPIFNVDTGLTKPGTIELADRGTLKVDGRAIACRHFKVTGPAPADLWFDDQNLLVRQKSVEDGHPTELRLRRIREQTAE